MALSPATVRSALAGDRVAFTELYKHYNPKLRRYLAPYVRRNPDQLDDLMQLVWMQVWKSLPGFRGDSEFSTWAYRIGVNEALMWIRKPATKQAAVTLSLDEPISAESEIPREFPVTDPGFAWVEGYKERESLHAAIEQMPSYSRIVFKMRLKGMMFSEIAQATDLSLGTVKSIHFRGIRMLQQRMGQ